MLLLQVHPLREHAPSGLHVRVSGRHETRLSRLCLGRQVQHHPFVPERPDRDNRRPSRGHLPLPDGRQLRHLLQGGAGTGASGEHPRAPDHVRRAGVRAPGPPVGDRGPAQRRQHDAGQEGRPRQLARGAGAQGSDQGKGGSALPRRLPLLVRRGVAPDGAGSALAAARGRRRRGRHGPRRVVLRRAGLRAGLYQRVHQVLRAQPGSGQGSRSQDDRHSLLRLLPALQGHVRQDGQAESRASRCCTSPSSSTGCWARASCA